MKITEVIQGPPPPPRSAPGQVYQIITKDGRLGVTFILMKGGTKLWAHIIYTEAKPMVISCNDCHIDGFNYGEKLDPAKFKYLGESKDDLGPVIEVAS